MTDPARADQRRHPMLELGIAGVGVGHWTDPVARTGCTVMVLPDGTVASGEVRGGAPATREFELLAPDRMVNRIDAITLSGGSAFGLAACDGVVQHLEELGRGFATPHGVVPIVVGMSLFDLATGDPSVRPGAVEGRRAASDAIDAIGGSIEWGGIGAGTGTQTGTWRGPQAASPGGLGAAVVRDGGLVVAAFIAVNAFGDIDHGRPIVDTLASLTPGPSSWGTLTDAFVHTTIGVVVTNARLDKVGCLVVAQGGHDGYARSLVPAHTRFDGDAIVAAATGSFGQEVPVDVVRLLAVGAVESAIRSLAD